MTCPVCHAETAPGARVCFNCETVFPGDRDSVVELVRESAERDQLLRAARTSSKHGPDSLADDYAALEYANW